MISDQKGLFHINIVCFHSSELFFSSKTFRLIQNRASERWIQANKPSLAMLFDVGDKGLLKRFDMKLEAGGKLKFFGDPINFILISKDQANVPKPHKNMKSLSCEIDVYNRKGVNNYHDNHDQHRS